ncbi:ATP-binding protein [Polycladomyces sp. WAk]|uniref:ATP-binding protein n=2 Tax=Polycladomyces zharkentensis TaxID=2807616 RepID=A0ABS2WEH9_9BACL|nr:ATP-binding protein [Polycladomyces sp. WAk]
MPKLIVLMGLPGSGKSTYANRFDHCVVLSSDAIRKELFNDVQYQGNNALVFDTLYGRAKEYLEHGYDVVIDSTHLEAHRRLQVIDMFREYEKEIHVIHTPVDECKRRNRERERIVPENVIDQMAKKMEYPTYEEGWSKIVNVNPVHSVAVEPQDGVTTHP